MAATPAASAPAREAVLAFLAACGAVAVLAVVGRAVPFVWNNLAAFVAVAFLYLPLLWLRRRGEYLEDYGFHLAPVGRGLAIAGVFVAIVLPLFAAGYVGFYALACRHGAGWLATLPEPGHCARFHGWGGLHWPALALHFPPRDRDLVVQVFGQLVVTALPEEMFFRGYLHELCERRWPPTRRILGGGVGWALVVSSAMFAAVHPIIWQDPRRLVVFFPGLVFGWMRSATGSILAGTLTHAASNLFLVLLDACFL
jgi:membrane protease YdiL (CAAX protease family)